MALNDDDMVNDADGRAASRVAAPTAPANVEVGAGAVALVVSRLPATSFFLTSAVFHYLGPSLAVLLFTRLGPMGVAWWRIVTAAVVFALWRRPWRLLARMTGRQRWVLLGLGVVLAAMNAVFYLALNSLPLATVGAIEFLGTLALAAAGARTRRNLTALALAVVGVGALTELRLVAAPWGFAFAFANAAGFLLYVVLGHRIAHTRVDQDSHPHAPGSDPAGEGDPGSREGSRVDMSGIDQLAAAMIVAAVAITPAGLTAALPAFAHPLWLIWAVGVGICSSVIPYVSDQLAMARLPRATFALMLALLPAAATVMGLVLLAQVPTWQDLAGVGLVIVAILIHHDAPDSSQELPHALPDTLPDTLRDALPDPLPNTVPHSRPEGPVDGNTQEIPR
jgi:inner membrane transporter RhtA